MDNKDLKIIEAIKYNARASTRELAKKTKLPITTIHNRLKKLENDGVIEGYNTVINYEKLGKPILTYIFLTVDYTKFKHLTQSGIKKEIQNKINPEELGIITGSYDVILKMNFRTPKEISKTIEALRKIEGVDKTQSMIKIE